MSCNIHGSLKTGTTGFGSLFGDGILNFSTLSLRQNRFATSFLGVKIITIFLEILQPPINCVVPQLVLPLITP